MHCSELKLFYKRLIAYLVMVAVFAVVLDILSILPPTSYAVACITDSERYTIPEDSEQEYIQSVRDAMTPDGSTRLIVGDSVCRQIFVGLRDINPDFCIIGTNAAITMGGQYIMIKEYLDAHPEAEEVYLMVIPAAFQYAYNGALGYNNGVVPYVLTDTLHDLDEDTINTLRKTFGSFAINPKTIGLIRNSGLNKKIYFDLLNKYAIAYKDDGIYDVSKMYIGKIAELCRERGVEFYMYPCPATDVTQSTCAGIWDTLKGSVIYEANPEYLDMMYFFDEEMTVDGVHFYGDYANQETYNEFIRTMYGQTPLLEHLRLE